MLPLSLAVLTGVCCSYASQLESDSAAVNIIGNSHCLAGVSLAAKWAPREGSTTDKKCSAVRKVRGTDRYRHPSNCSSVWGLSQLSELMFAGCHDKKTKYRQLVATVNKAIGTVEVSMSGQQWDLVSLGSCCAASWCDASLV